MWYHLSCPVNNSLYHKKKIYIFCHKPLISRHAAQNEHSNYIIFHPEVKVIVKDLRTSLYCSCLHLELSKLRKTCLMDMFLFCIFFFFFLKPCHPMGDLIKASAETSKKRIASLSTCSCFSV